VSSERIQQYRADIWKLVLPGFCASFVAIGLARFAYTPLLPAIVARHLFSADSAAYLAAANLAGYLLGVIVAEGAARRAAGPLLLRLAMLTATASLFACAFPWGTGWFFVCRVFSGIAGGIVMVMAAPTIFPHVAPSRRGFVAGAVFMGVGVGIALSGTVVPLLLRWGIGATWLGLGVIALVFTLIGWNGWLPATVKAEDRDLRKRRLPRTTLRGLYLIYGLNAFALVPHMVFFTDFVARGLAQGLDVATRYWVIYGIGAITGPLVAGRAADRWGAYATLMMMLVLQLGFVALPALDTSPVTLFASSLAMGACTIGIVPVVLGRTREILRHHPAAHFSAWRAATVSFALLQAAGAYGMSILYQWSRGSYTMLFAAGAAALALALATSLLSQRLKEA
jgi:predicted MFS family arabinose efflux permease